MLDRDLAELYGVETRTWTQAVRRNKKRFPADFMFMLEEQEVNRLMSQFVISKPFGRGGTRKPPMVFTEQGIAMLSGILRSDRAIEVNIAIMRAFVKMRQMLAGNEELKKKIWNQFDPGVTLRSERMFFHTSAFGRVIARASMQRSSQSCFC